MLSYNRITGVYSPVLSDTSINFFHRHYFFCIEGTFFWCPIISQSGPVKGLVRTQRSESRPLGRHAQQYPVGLGKMTAGRLSHAETMLLIFEGGNRSRELHSPLCVPQGHIWGGGATVYDGSPRTGSIVSDWGCTRGQPPRPQAARVDVLRFGSSPH